MAKGFTKDGKFRPTGNNGRKSSREKSIETTGLSMREQEFFRGDLPSEYENFEFKEGKELVSVNDLVGYDSALVPEKYDAFAGNTLTIFVDNLDNQLSFHDLRNLHHQHEFYLEEKKKDLERDDNLRWKHIGIHFEIIDTSLGSVFEFRQGSTLVDNVTLEEAFDDLEKEFGKNLVRINGIAESNEDDPTINMGEFVVDGKGEPSFHQKLLLKEFKGEDNVTLSDENGGIIINVDKGRTLDIIREMGGATSREIADGVTKNTEDEGFSKNIGVSLHLEELESEGVIVFIKGEWIPTEKMTKEE